MTFLKIKDQQMEIHVLCETVRCCIIITIDGSVVGY